MRKLKTYIAGKITGDKDYKEKFEVLEEYIKKTHGSIVLNPARLPEGMQNGDYMRICLAMIDTADIVFFLPDWKKSGGAKVESAYAEYCQKMCVYLNQDTLSEIREML